MKRKMGVHNLSARKTFFARTLQIGLCYRAVFISAIVSALPTDRPLLLGYIDERVII